MVTVDILAGLFSFIEAYKCPSNACTRNEVRASFGKDNNSSLQVNPVLGAENGNRPLESCLVMEIRHSGCFSLIHTFSQKGFKAEIRFFSAQVFCYLNSMQILRNVKC